MSYYESDYDRPRPYSARRPSSASSSWFSASSRPTNDYKDKAFMVYDEARDEFDYRRPTSNSEQRRAEERKVLENNDQFFRREGESQAKIYDYGHTSYCNDDYNYDRPNFERRRPQTPMRRERDDSEHQSRPQRRPGTPISLISGYGDQLEATRRPGTPVLPQEIDFGAETRVQRRPSTPKTPYLAQEPNYVDANDEIRLVRQPAAQEKYSMPEDRVLRRPTTPTPLMARDISPPRRPGTPRDNFGRGSRRPQAPWNQNGRGPRRPSTPGPNFELLTPYQGRDQCWGKFNCAGCDKTWTSESCFANEGKNCKFCGIIVYPHKMLTLRTFKRRASNWNPSISKPSTQATAQSQGPISVLKPATTDDESAPKRKIVRFSDNVLIKPPTPTGDEDEMEKDVGMQTDDGSLEKVTRGTQTEAGRRTLFATLWSQTEERERASVASQTERKAAGAGTQTEDEGVVLRDIVSKVVAAEKK